MTARAPHPDSAETSDDAFASRRDRAGAVAIAILLVTTVVFGWQIVGLATTLDPVLVALALAE